MDGRGQGGQLGAVRDVLAAEKSPLAAKPVASEAQRHPKGAEPHSPLATHHSPLPPRVRAALAMDDALSRALGRPNREQVVTRRDSLATMLQALELVNGTTLDDILNRGARQWMKQGENDSRKIVERAYRTALGRRPTDSERNTAAAVVGTPPSAEGVHDLLWMVVMLPEFQLIE